LNVEVFISIDDVKRKLQAWRQDYNEHRLHGSPEDKKPIEFIENYKKIESEKKVFNV
jgi:hypothetical protein